MSIDHERSGHFHLLLAVCAVAIFGLSLALVLVRGQRTLHEAGIVRGVGENCIDYRGGDNRIRRICLWSDSCPDLKTLVTVGDQFDVEYEIKGNFSDYRRFINLTVVTPEHR
jgi:hypothetical protein